MTPMLQQYFRMKEENPGCILFFRCGDFFETYGDDAETASRELEIVLTKKDAGDGQKVYMAGVPYFTVDTYVYSLVGKGYKVAIADQVEDPKTAKGLVRREVVKILTAGTITEPQMLDSSKNNYLGAVCTSDGKYSAAFCDILTGEFSVTETDFEELENETEKWSPSEILTDKALEGSSYSSFLASSEIQTSYTDFPSYDESMETIRKYYSLPKEAEIQISVSASAVRACGEILSYLLETQKNSIPTLKMPEFSENSDYASVDAVTKKNLELLETISGREKKGTLLWAMDAACTAMGKRLLRSWIVRPLIRKSKIEERLDAVEELASSYGIQEKLSSILKKLQDFERLISKTVMGSATPRDLLALGTSLVMLPELAEILSQSSSKLLKKVSKFENLKSLGEKITETIRENPPISAREGDILKDGISSELDELRQIRREGKNIVLSIEERERARTGIKSLKIKFNQVFGYFIEISKSFTGSVPEDYIRKQTLTNAERYINQELKEYEAKILGAEERIKALEYSLFQELAKATAMKAESIQDIATKTAVIDVIRGFAETASLYGYSKPEILSSAELEIKNGRHPVVERITRSGFVSNDISLSGKSRLSIITGPNMSGKSTYLRQNALIALMAQTGSFVPAEKARIGIADKFFTRVGATDDLHLGQSTFMVEMLETANILNNATPKSIVILDEIGRGTSTYDGMSIAYAVCEHLYSKSKSRTLFATHFHELTALSEAFPGITNLRVAVKEVNGEVIFLHRIIEGVSDKSYGIYVASLAGFPESVLEKARKILSELEKNMLPGGIGKTAKQAQPDRPAGMQLTFFDSSAEKIADEIREVNISELAPIEALNKIYKWQSELKKSF